MKLSKNSWIVIGVIGVVILIYWIMTKNKKSNSESSFDKDRFDKSYANKKYKTIRVAKKYKLSNVGGGIGLFQNFNAADLPKDTIVYGNKYVATPNNAPSPYLLLKIANTTNEYLKFSDVVEALK